MADGEFLFTMHCASCHGREGKGEGPMSELLTVTPPDLRDLRQRHEGRFPREEIWEIVDGRTEVLGHGSREMPIWGMTFQDPGRDANQEPEVRRRIGALLDYLESIQVDDDD